jgi:Zn-dependent protease
MVYHAYINVMIIVTLVSLASSTPLPTLSQVFIDPIGLGLIFAVSFLVHELSHLYTGKHFQFPSRFCLTNEGMKATKKAAIIGFPFGLPGAAISVGVDPDRDKDKMGWIKTAGPTSNAILGIVFLIVGYFLRTVMQPVALILMQGASLNFLLGAFNLIPLRVKGFELDGGYISRWNKTLYISLFVLMTFGIFLAMLLTSNFYYL